MATSRLSHHDIASGAVQAQPAPFAARLIGGLVTRDPFLPSATLPLLKCHSKHVLLRCNDGAALMG